MTISTAQAPFRALHSGSRFLTMASRQSPTGPWLSGGVDFTRDASSGSQASDFPSGFQSVERRTNTLGAMSQLMRAAPLLPKNSMPQCPTVSLILAALVKVALTPFGKA